VATIRVSPGTQTTNLIGTGSDTIQPIDWIGFTAAEKESFGRIQRLFPKPGMDNSEIDGMEHVVLHLAKSKMVDME
jgi:hypothetical protein